MGSYQSCGLDLAISQLGMLMNLMPVIHHLGSDPLDRLSDLSILGHQLTERSAESDSHCCRAK
jgi:hypothetical protein